MSFFFLLRLFQVKLDVSQHVELLHKWELGNETQMVTVLFFKHDLMKAVYSSTKGKPSSWCSCTHLTTWSDAGGVNIVSSFTNWLAQLRYLTYHIQRGSVWDNCNHLSWLHPSRKYGTWEMALFLWGSLKL